MSNNNNSSSNRGKEENGRGKGFGGSKGFGRGSRPTEEKKSNELKWKENYKDHSNHSSNSSQQSNQSSSVQSSIPTKRGNKEERGEKRIEKKESNVQKKNKKGGEEEKKWIALEEETCLWNEKNVSRFSTHWMEDIDFIPFVLNQKFRKKEGKEESKQEKQKEGEEEMGFDFVTIQEMIQNINLDLSKLLKMDFKSFWCQVGFDSSFEVFYDSFLRYAPRSFEFSSSFLSFEDDSMQSIFRRVFAIVIRMSKNQESQSQFFSKDFHSNFIYQKKFFDIPKLMDLSLLFGGCNNQILSETFETLFDRQPKYWSDLSLSFQQSINSLSQSLQNLMKEENTNSDLSDYLLDILASLSSFLFVFPKSCGTLGTNHPNLFELIIPQIWEEWISKLEGQKEKQKVELVSRFCLNICCSLLESFYFQSALNRLSSNAERKEGTKKTLEVLEKLVKFPKTLLAAISNSFLIQTKLHEMKYELSNLDSLEVTKIDHFSNILERISGPFAPSDLNSNINIDETHSLILQVKSLLPDLGEGFIEACLESFGNDPEKVINRIFEDNLPPHLMELDRSTPRQPSKVSLVSARKNIYNGDEFDIMAGTSSNVKILQKK
eukprot:TRINITY_DN3302_c1_g1_i2.p1 TRINITY_DN3302_c1_g1~~TRINITY_DN3302_c1_g1_i2.p1  ORF type:complete len:604 (+),score=238.04 TRINITY_DN3302_c1_g1_i2:111-1922(+)